MIIEEIKTVISQSSRRDWRQFGYVMAGVLILLSLFALWKQKPWGQITLPAGLLFLLAAWFAPRILKGLYAVWMSLAVTMGFIMTRVILTLLFLIVFAPAGLILRLLRKDPLHQSIDPSASSYWIRRKPQRYDPVQTEKQY